MSKIWPSSPVYGISKTNSITERPTAWVPWAARAGQCIWKRLLIIYCKQQPCIPYGTWLGITKCWTRLWLQHFDTWHLSMLRGLLQCSWADLISAPFYYDLNIHRHLYILYLYYSIETFWHFLFKYSSCIRWTHCTVIQCCL